MLIVQFSRERERERERERDCLCTNIPKTQPTNFVGVLLKDKAAEQSAKA